MSNKQPKSKCCCSCNCTCHNQPCEPAVKVVKEYDFTKEGSWNQDDWDFGFTPVGGNGVVTQDACGLTVTNNPFTDAGLVRVGNDHVKWLALSKENLPLDETKNEKVYYEARVGNKQYFDDAKLQAWMSRYSLQGRISDKDSDIRLASSAINIVDLASFLVLDFLLSNNTIYAFYERLPFAKSTHYLEIDGKPVLNPQGTSDYAAFSHAIPVHKKCPNEKFHDLAIAINAKKGKASWYVNGRKVFSVCKLGFRLDSKFRILDHQGSDELVKLGKSSACRYGFGNFTLMDMLKPRAYSNDVDDNSKTSLVQLDYFENYGELDGSPLKKDCCHFGINAGCTCGQKSAPNTSDDRSVPHSIELLEHGSGSSITVNRIRVYTKCRAW